MPQLILDKNEIAEIIKEKFNIKPKVEITLNNDETIDTEWKS